MCSYDIQSNLWADAQQCCAVTIYGSVYSEIYDSAVRLRYSLQYTGYWCAVTIYGAIHRLIYVHKLQMCCYDIHCDTQADITKYYAFRLQITL